MPDLSPATEREPKPHDLAEDGCALVFFLRHGDMSTSASPLLLNMVECLQGGALVYKFESNLPTANHHSIRCNMPVERCMQMLAAMNLTAIPAQQALLTATQESQQGFQSSQKSS